MVFALDKKKRGSPQATRALLQVPRLAGGDVHRHFEAETQISRNGGGPGHVSISSLGVV
jgi:hypothetical protein